MLYVLDVERDKPTSFNCSFLDCKQVNSCLPLLQIHVVTARRLWIGRSSKNRSNLGILICAWASHPKKKCSVIFSLAKYEKRLHPKTEHLKKYYYWVTLQTIRTLFEGKYGVNTSIWKRGEICLWVNGQASKFLLSSLKQTGKRKQNWFRKCFPDKLY